MKAARRFSADLARISGLPGDIDIRTITLGARVTGDASLIAATTIMSTRFGL